ncbi:MAG: hypothetical protein ABJQ14_24115 [Hyphomicrobiales bacterium]
MSVLLNTIMEDLKASVVDALQVDILTLWVSDLNSDGGGVPSFLPLGTRISADNVSALAPMEYVLQVYDTTAAAQLVRKHHVRWNPDDFCQMGIQTTGEATLMIGKPGNGGTSFAIEDMRHHPQTKIVGSWEPPQGGASEDELQMSFASTSSARRHAENIVKCLSGDLADTPVARNLLHIISSDLPETALFMPGSDDVSLELKAILSPIKAEFHPVNASQRGDFQGKADKIRKFASSLIEKVAIDVLAYGEGKMI